MTATLDRRLSVANGGAPEPPRWGQGRADPVARVLAQMWGMTPKSAEHQLSGPHSVFNRAADGLRVMKAQGCENRLARASRDILAALDGREAPPLVPATWNLAQEADAAEDVAELAYQLDQSRENRQRLIRAKEKTVIRELALIDALRAEDEKAGA